MKSWGPTGPQFFRSLLSGGQEYPNLRQYLKIRLQQSAERGKRLGIAGGIIGGAAGGGAGSVSAKGIGPPDWPKGDAGAGWAGGGSACCGA